MKTRRFFDFTQTVLFSLFLTLFFCGCEILEEAAAPENNSVFIVNTTDDTSDINPGDDRCEDVNGNCSLRAAIQEANSRNQLTYTIELDDETYLLDSTLVLNTFAAQIRGKGQERTIIDGGRRVRVFEIIGDESTVSTVTINNLTITNGRALDSEGSSGGGILILGTPGVTLESVTISNNRSALNGGGIHISSGLVTMESCLIHGNLSEVGGGISNTGRLTIMNSAIFQNKTNSDRATTNTGGGIYNNSPFSLKMINSTISSNNGKRGLDIYNTGGKIEITSCSIVSELAFQAEGSMVFNEGDSLKLKNTVVALGILEGDNIFTLGGNFIDFIPNSFELLGSPVQPDILPDFPGSRIAVKLGLLEQIDETWGHKPLTDSPLIDAVSDGECSSETDQSGYIRTGSCDIGAIEYR